MISYILYICIVLFLTYIGYFLSGKYRAAKKFYVDWEQFHQKFLTEAGYARRPLGEVIESFKDRGAFGAFLTEYGKRHVWEGKIDFFGKEDNDFLREYFSFLGRTDFKAQKEYFDGVNKKLSSARERAEKDAVRYTDLYVKLGFLLGLIAVILLL